MGKGQSARLDFVAKISSSAAVFRLEFAQFTLLPVAK
jgi:hypothetical protein